MTKLRTFKPNKQKVIYLNLYNSNKKGEYIIGMPRLKNEENGPNSRSLINDALPVMEIMPSFHEYSMEGAQTFKLIDGFKQGQSVESKSYKEELEETYGVALPEEQNNVKVAFQANSNFSDSFSNEFGESSLSKLAGGLSGIMGELKFATGITTPTDLFDKLPNKGLWKNQSEIYKSKLISEAKKRGMTEDQVAEGGGLIKTALSALVNRINIPLFWTGSTWSPSYSISVRLYNPYPADDAAYAAFILAPLTMLLMFVVPRTTDGSTYFWPWLCSYKIPGLAGIKAGYIRSINVSKGGDVNSISLLQRPVVVDLKIDMGALHTTMSDKSPTTSSLVEYLEILKGKKDWNKPIEKISPQRPDWAGEGSAPPSPAATAEEIQKEKANSTPATGGIMQEVIDSLSDAQDTSDALVMEGTPTIRADAENQIEVIPVNPPPQ